MLGGVIKVPRENYFFVLGIQDFSIDTRQVEEIINRKKNEWANPNNRNPKFKQYLNDIDKIKNIMLDPKSRAKEAELAKYIREEDAVKKYENDNPAVNEPIFLHYHNVYDFINQRPTETDEIADLSIDTSLDDLQRRTRKLSDNYRILKKDSEMRLCGFCFAKIFANSGSKLEYDDYVKTKGKIDARKKLDDMVSSNNEISETVFNAILNKSSELYEFVLKKHEIESCMKMNCEVKGIKIKSDKTFDKSSQYTNSSYNAESRQTDKFVQDENKEKLRKLCEFYELEPQTENKIKEAENETKRIDRNIATLSKIKGNRIVALLFAIASLVASVYLLNYLLQYAEKDKNIQNYQPNIFASYYIFAFCILLALMFVLVWLRKDKLWKFMLSIMFLSAPIACIISFYIYGGYSDISGTIVLFTGLAVLLLILGLKTKKSMNKKIAKKEIAKLVVIRQQKNNEIMQLENELSAMRSAFEELIEFLPKKYRNAVIVKTMYEYYENLRVRTLTDAINLFEQESRYYRQ